MYDIRRNLRISCGSAPPKSRRRRKIAFDEKKLYFRNSVAWLKSRVKLNLFFSPPDLNMDKGSCAYTAVLIYFDSPALGTELFLEPFFINNKLTKLIFL